MSPTAQSFVMPQSSTSKDFGGFSPDTFASSMKGHNQMPEHSMNTLVIEIQLDAELLATFCRRGRRRLREIQTSSQAVLKLDRSRSVLRASGTESQIAEVRRQLECLGGPRKQITAALWAELMRTRTLQDTSTAAIECIQQQSQCRVHIERSKHEVRLFGPKPAVAVADRLLDALANMCLEKVVQVSDITALASEMLHLMAHTCSVTLRVEKNCVFVLGLAVTVQTAAEELKRYVSNPQNFQLSIRADAMNKIVSDSLIKLKEEGNYSGGNCSDDDTDSDRCQPKARTFQAFISPKQASQKGGQQCCDHCGTNLSGNFCVNCGKPNPNATMQAQVMPMANLASLMQPLQNMQTSMSLASVAALGNSRHGPDGAASNSQTDMSMQNLVPLCIPQGMMMMQQPQSFPKGSEFDTGGNANDTMMYMVPIGIMPGMPMQGENMQAAYASAQTGSHLFTC
mmetsp:Transcript_84452/g.149423  ORF Transcript_84452/g.149423 Transcript_84452/m.149423 type:complete len:455 (-) Transcript_84452:167-1531(-)